MGLRPHRVHEVEKLADEEPKGVQAVGVNSGDCEIFNELAFSLEGPGVPGERRGEVPGEMADGAGFPDSPERPGRVEQNRLEHQDEAYLLHETQNG